MRTDVMTTDTITMAGVASRDVDVKRRNRFLLIAALHIAYGMTVVSIPAVHPISFYTVFFYAIQRIIRTRNADETAAIWSMYLVGVEIVNRMIGGVNHEMTKYAISALLMAGMIAERKTGRSIPIRFVMYCVLLLPSVLIIDIYDMERYRQLISANLSGPMLLGVAVLYFHDRRYSLLSLQKLIRLAAYPLLTATTIIRIRGPVSDAIEMSYMSSSGVFAGGAGTNQVSTILGYGIVIIVLSLLLTRGITRYKYVDYVFVGVLLFQAFLTFSRGGVYAAGLSIVFGIMVSIAMQKRIVGRIKVLATAVLIAILSMLVFEYVNEITGESLEKRYEGRTGTEGKRNIATGRERIFVAYLKVFSENYILGVGPGMAAAYRVKHYGQFAASHIELSRLLAEHGLLGLICILIVYGSALARVVSARKNRSLLLWSGMLIILGLATTFHNATRLAMPMVVYGLAFIRITDDDEHPPSK